VVGVVRVDFCGALMLSAAGRVASVEADAICYANGLVYRRRGSAGPAVRIWGFTAGSIVR